MKYDLVLDTRGQKFVFTELFCVFILMSSSVTNTFIKDENQTVEEVIIYISELQHDTR